MKQICVITMIGPFDIIGELKSEVGSDEAKLFHPCMLHPQQDGKVALRDMTRGNAIVTGDHILLNMRCVLWVSEPSSALHSAYQAQRAGLVVAGKMAQNNSIKIDQLRQ